MRKENDLPSSIEAEKAVLGSIILEPNLWDSLSVEIDENDFIANEHKLIFRGIKKLIDLGSDLDTVTLIESLSGDSELSTLSNFDRVNYVKNLVSDTPGTANFSNYTNIIKQSSSLRKLISTAADISSLAKEADTFESDSALSEAEDKLIKLRDSIQRNSGPLLAKDLIKPVYDNIDKTMRSDGDLVGISTGFRDLDKYTMGLQEGDLFIIAGRPSMGKTAFALSIAGHLVNESIPCVLFSLEMSARSIMYRLISLLGKIELKKLFEAKNLSDSDFNEIENSLSLLSRSKFYIDDTSALSPSEILSRSRKLKRENPDLGLIIIDYMQLMRADNRNDNRVSEMSEISRSLKALAKEIDVPVIALSQLNRAPETRTGKKPVLADLKDSGAIEQDADIVTFVFRAEKYEQVPENKGLAVIDIAKHRNGPTGTVKLYFSEKYTKFEDLALDDPALKNPDFTSED
ncbi:MAG: replicative DNA helicase [Gammaproteobacteria bacterium]|nr:MAG: replicative DNA helicase [Gammaproteobacteria bacterium]